TYIKTSVLHQLILASAVAIHQVYITSVSTKKLFHKLFHIQMQTFRFALRAIAMRGCRCHDIGQLDAATRSGKLAATNE
ncbi:hypothetical protein, partial [Acetobacter lambici]|uniref:hypothetical protein n=1 Tax=Acetobacter lambici TaxID=1332824 RepID=UPI0020A2DE5B